MVRTRVRLKKEQYAALKAIAVKEGVSLSEVIRRAVDQTIVLIKNTHLNKARASEEIPHLKELLAKVDPEKHEGEVMAWEPVGKEAFYDQKTY
jgi:hypothetical protein